jgi:hypothetical protein
MAGTHEQCTGVCMVLKIPGNRARKHTLPVREEDIVLNALGHLVHSIVRDALSAIPNTPPTHSQHEGYQFYYPSGPTGAPTTEIPRMQSPNRLLGMT